MKHGLNNKCNQSIQHYIANIINLNKYNDSALMVLTPLDTKETQDIFAKHTAHCTFFTEHTVQLLSEIFLDSDFCHNYLHTPVTLNW